MTATEAIDKLRGVGRLGTIYEDIAPLIERQASRIADLEEAVRCYNESTHYRCTCRSQLTVPTKRNPCAFCETVERARAAAEKGKE